MKKEKRISFGEYDTEHIYDLALGNFQGGCWLCDRIKKRIEKFLGKKTVKFVKRNNKKHPYEKNTKTIRN